MFTMHLDEIGKQSDGPSGEDYATVIQRSFKVDLPAFIVDNNYGGGYKEVSEHTKAGTLKKYLQEMGCVE